MNVEIINTIIAIIVGGGIIVAGSLYVFGSWRKQTDEASVASNKILRDLISDQKEEILKMRDRQHQFVNEMQVIRLQLQHLQDKREYLERLITISLLEYFKTDPSIVEAVKISIGKQNAIKEEK